VQIGRELVKVIDPRSMRFEGLVSAERMQEVKPGLAVRFRVNGFPQAEFLGTVRRVDATANAVTRQVEVLVDFAQATAAPQVAGLFAEGRINTGTQAALLLPESALVRSGDQAHVWRLQDAQVQRVAVKLGERDSRRGEYPVLGGLDAGDRVLRNPGSALVDGQAATLAAAINPAATAVPVSGPGAGAGADSSAGTASAVAGR
jgi:multidrug efflux pump subunit AcrA (membrane-fusion protein)